MLLTIWHGQASVEPGYSVNKDILIENIQEKTVIALRTIYGSVSGTDGHFSEMLLTPKLTRHMKSVRMRYNQYLEDTRVAWNNEEKGKKHKAVQETIHEVETKKHKVECSIEILRKDADELAKKAREQTWFHFAKQVKCFQEEGLWQNWRIVKARR